MLSSVPTAELIQGQYVGFPIVVNSFRYEPKQTSFCFYLKSEQDFVIDYWFAFIEVKH